MASQLSSKNIISDRYASALYDLSEESKNVDVVLKDLEFLRSKNYKIIATANEKKSIDVNQFKNPGKHVLIFGSEGHGISKEIISSADQTIKIPVDPYVEHLNVGHAAAIFFYQLSNHKRL